MYNLLSGEYVWVFTRPDKMETVQLPTPSQGDSSEELWWTVMVVLLKLFQAI